MPDEHHAVYERAIMRKLRRVPIVCTIFLLAFLATTFPYLEGESNDIHNSVHSFLEQFCPGNF